MVEVSTDTAPLPHCFVIGVAMWASATPSTRTLHHSILASGAMAGRVTATTAGHQGTAIVMTATLSARVPSSLDSPLERNGFAVDSPLEEGGFELPVPGRVR
jgi:hypothetical protein